MLKRLTFVFIVALSAACRTSSNQPGCDTKVCTDIFVTVGLQFVDNTGKLIQVEGFSAINQRTHLNMMPAPQNQALITGYFDIADDNMKSQLSTDGDDILITATNPATHQTKTVTLKVSGGCNCHVAKISGPDTVTFD